MGRRTKDLHPTNTRRCATISTIAEFSARTGSPQVTVIYGNFDLHLATVEWRGLILMHSEQPANTVVMVGATRPDPGLENEMQARGVRMRWVRTIQEAAALLNPVVNRTVVVSEVALKDGNWRDLLEALRYSSIPVLLVSSTRTAELWWDALDCGVEDILAAPLSTSRLCEYLQKQFTKQK